MAVKEKVITTDHNNRQLSVEQVDENYINFHTKHKKEDYEVNFYVFSENEINELREKQRKIYELIDIQNSKSSFQNTMEKILQLLKHK